MLAHERAWHCPFHGCGGHVDGCALMCSTSAHGGTLQLLPQSTFLTISFFISMILSLVFSWAHEENQHSQRIYFMLTKPYRIVIIVIVIIVTNFELI